FGVDAREGGHHLPGCRIENLHLGRLRTEAVDRERPSVTALHPEDDKRIAVAAANDCLDIGGIGRRRELPSFAHWSASSVSRSCWMPRSGTSTQAGRLASS